MDTGYFIVDKEQPDKVIMEKAAKILMQGGLVAFPTETVYGLGANGLDSEAVSKIYQAKGRPSDNPLILHIASQQDLIPLVKEISPNAQRLMDDYWPGPLTVVLKGSDLVPDNVAGGLDTVAIRLPDCVVAQELIRKTGMPIAAPSANTSGRPSPTTAEAVLADLDGRIDAIIDAGSCAIGLESTVVDCTTPIPTLLRPGGITLEMLMDTLGEVEVDPTLGGSVECLPRSPGMKYTHYAPAASMTLFEGQYPQIISLMLPEIESALLQGKRVGAIVSEQTMQRLPAGVVAVSYGLREDIEQIATNLYTALRSFDENPVDVIYAEGIAEEGLGLAIMNRLRKASGYRIIKG